MTTRVVPVFLALFIGSENQIKAAKFQSTNMKTAIAQLKKKQKKKYK